MSLSTPLEGVGNVAIGQLSLGRGLLLGQDHAAGRTARIELLRSGPQLPDVAATVTVRGSAGGNGAGAGGGAGAAETEGPAGAPAADFEIPVAVRFAAGARKASASVALPALPTSGGVGTSGGASGELGANRGNGGSLSLSAELASAVAGAAVADAIVRDNTALASAVTADRLNIVIIGDGQGGARFGLADGAGSIVPSRWFELAASPSAATPVSSVVLDAALVDATVLADADAVIITCPQKLGEAATAAVRKVIDRGGMVLLTPPADVTLHSWADMLAPALGVALRLPREATAIGGGDAGVGANGASGAGGATGTGGTAAGGTAGIAERLDATFVPGPAAAEMLGSLSGELADLLPAVGLLKMLAPEPGEGAGGGAAAEPLLVSSAGRIVLSLLADATVGKAAAGGGAGVGGGAGDRSAPAASHMDGNGDSTDRGIGVIEGKAASTNPRGPVLYLSVAADPAWTDLPAKPLFVPLIQEILRQGAGRAKRSIVLAAGRELALPPGAARLMRVAGFGAKGFGGASGGRADDRSGGAGGGPGGVVGGASVPVGADGRPSEPLRLAGLYRVVLQSGLAAGTVVVEPDTAASNTDATGRAEIERWLAPASGTSLVWMDLGNEDGTNGGEAGVARDGAAAKPAAVSDGLAWLFGAALLLALAEIVLAQRADRPASGKVAMVGTLAGRRQGGGGGGGGGGDSGSAARGARDA